jgi:PAS domain S-box-containing protein
MMQATEHIGDDEPDLFLEEEEASGSAGASADDLPPWRILIVDDDVDVHVVTKFALSNTHFQGRRLSFLHAYSAREALDKLRTTPDIALVLLDVMMETADAGLRFARQVRDELHNTLVRIVLRTGQAGRPGQAVEHNIIVDYDINDFWSKADLTTRKLFTTVIVALRAYASIAHATRQRDEAAAQLASAREILSALDRHAAVLTLDARGRVLDANPHFCRIAGTTIEQLRGRDLHTVHPAPFPQPLAGEILATLARGEVWSGTLDLALASGPCRLHASVQPFQAADGSPQHYVAVAAPAAGPDG